MTAKNAIPPEKVPLLCSLVVLLGAIGIALASARPYAGGWNDGSRLATVEALVDYHTLAIDDSIFVRVPEHGPYDPSDPSLAAFGTADKLYIQGHYYSDKSPVPALLLAGVYQVLQWGTGLRAAEAPERYCYVLTVSSSGVAYVASVWLVFQLGGLLRLPLASRLLLAASLAVATMALPYVRHVNNHIFLLGVACAITVQLTALAAESRAGRVPPYRFWVLGILTGLGYSIDLGAGPVLVASVVAVAGWRCRSVTGVLQVIAFAAPWLVLHHVVNYSVGGTIKPANAVPEHFRWPGCPFTEATLTGGWHGRSVLRTVVYSLEMLVGKQGFLGHNLPLLLAVVGILPLLRRAREARPELLFALGWGLATWLAYALTSTNYSGRCCSVRWYLPLLAPAYLVLAQLLQSWPRTARDLWILTGSGCLLGIVMWQFGPWNRVPGILYWPIVTAALISWIGSHFLPKFVRTTARRGESSGSASLSRAA
jgi:hypothetical protein